jgi:hypothetical protein
MFPSWRTSPLAQRALGALDLARSFLLLEDDYAVDWEVDRNEPDAPVHPHRVPLSRRSHARRAGGNIEVHHVCLSPIFKGERSGRRSAAAAHEAVSLERRGSHLEGDGRPARADTRAGRLCPPACENRRRLA